MLRMRTLNRDSTVGAQLVGLAWCGALLAEHGLELSSVQLGARLGSAREVGMNIDPARLVLEHGTAPQPGARLGSAQLGARHGSARLGALLGSPLRGSARVGLTRLGLELVRSGGNPSDDTAMPPGHAYPMSHIHDSVARETESTTRSSAQDRER